MPAKTLRSNDLIQNEAGDLTKANRQIIDQLILYLTQIEDELYTKKPDQNTSPVGGHVRHIIEFYQEFIKAAQDNFAKGLCYDNRQRNVTLETSKADALDLLKQIKTRIKYISPQETSITLYVTLDPAQGELTQVSSSATREMFHLLDHATHHMAMIKMIAQSFDSACDQNFGMANATLAHQKKCAQ